jgi:hypothetical protein
MVRRRRELCRANAGTAASVAMSAGNVTASPSRLDRLGHSWAHRCTHRAHTPCLAVPLRSGSIRQRTCWNHSLDTIVLATHDRYRYALYGLVSATSASNLLRKRTLDSVVCLTILSLISAILDSPSLPHSIRSLRNLRTLLSSSLLSVVSSAPASLAAAYAVRLAISSAFAASSSSLIPSMKPSDNAPTNRFVT